MIVKMMLKSFSILQIKQFVPHPRQKNQSHWHTESSLRINSKTMPRPQLPSLMLPMDKVVVWLTATNLGGAHEESCRKDDQIATDLNGTRVVSGLACLNFYGVK